MTDNGSGVAELSELERPFAGQIKKWISKTERFNSTVRGRRAEMVEELLRIGLKRTEILGEGIELLYANYTESEIARRRLRALKSDEDGVTA